jgi:hypothetical protein
MGKVYARGGEPAMILSAAEKSAVVFDAVSKAAPSCTRLYRGFAIRWVWMMQRLSGWQRAADCKSAIRQIENLRYAGKNRLADIVKFC